MFITLDEYLKGSKIKDNSKFISSLLDVKPQTPETKVEYFFREMVHDREPNTSC